QGERGRRVRVPRIPRAGATAGSVRGTESGGQRPRQADHAEARAGHLLDQARTPLRVALASAEDLDHFVVDLAVRDDGGSAVDGAAARKIREPPARLFDQYLE